jgi:hypothetical protein
MALGGIKYERLFEKKSKNTLFKEKEQEQSSQQWTRSLFLRVG